jgi:hypothetical protein
MPAVTRTIPATTTADVLIQTGQAVLFGLAVEEDAGTPAVARFVLRDGTTTSGAIVLPVRLAASGSTYAWFNDGILFRNGLFLDMLSGSINGALFIG